MQAHNEQHNIGHDCGLLEKLQETIGYRFRCPALLHQALVHKSYANENQQESAHGNERLEFMGDAVLGLVVSHILMERAKDCPEGKLSNMRAAIVNEEELSELARKFGLGPCLCLSRGEEEGFGREKKSILANACEALIAAIYYDSGLPAAFQFIERHCSELITDVIQKGYYRDYKSRLQEYAMGRFGAVPRYVLVAQEGPDHERVFQSQVLIGGQGYATGQGASKKASEQDAAEKTLAALQSDTV